MGDLLLSKNFTFKQKVGTTLAEYWTMDGTGGNIVGKVAGTIWDSGNPQGLDPPPNGPTNGVQDIPGIIGRAMQCNLGYIDVQPGPVWQSSAKVFGLEAPSPMRIQANTKGASLWCWLKKTYQWDFRFGLSFRPLSWPVGSPNGGSQITIESGFFNGVYNVPSNQIYLQAHIGGMILPYPTLYQVFANAQVAYTNGAWAFVAVTWDATLGILNLFKDGVLISTYSTGGPTQIFAETNEVMIRPSWDIGLFGMLFQLAGLGTQTAPYVAVDEIGLSLDGAITQAQITALYNGGLGVTWPGVTSIVHP
jgi:hypothetical protein